MYAFVTFKAYAETNVVYHGVDFVEADAPVVINTDINTFRHDLLKVVNEKYGNAYHNVVFTSMTKFFVYNL